VIGRVKLHYEKLHNLYSLENIIRIVSNWVRYAVRVECMEETSSGTKF
jgi:hypothetical protein